MKYNEISDRFCTYALLQQKITAAVTHMHFFEENGSHIKVRKYTNAFYSKKISTIAQDICTSCNKIICDLKCISIQMHSSKKKTSISVQT
jgi:TPP-dependent indolepyruvate ferredoxin oxidoreductase alpha subunit